MTTIAPKIVEHPGVFIKDELEAREWSQMDLAFILGRPVQSINKIISGRGSVTPETSKELGAAFGVSPDLFANLQRSYDLARAAEPDPSVWRRARLQEPYPVREMIKRGWLAESDVDLLDAQMTRFFEVSSIDDIPHIAPAYAAKKTNYDSVSPLELAWVYRVRQIARGIQLPAYSEKLLRAALANLRELMIEPDESRHVPRILEECGVRFVVVETLPGAKICGATTWLSNREPVIGMTMRFDRIDNFWFVLRHEIEHVLCEHGQDVPIVDGDNELNVDGPTSDRERQANEASLDFPFTRETFEKFMLRKAPYVSRVDVLGFARKHNVHPGIVVGRVQKYLDRWNFLNEYKVNIRSYVLKAALFDGWGVPAPSDL